MYVSVGEFILVGLCAVCLCASGECEYEYVYLLVYYTQYSRTTDLVKECAKLN